MFQAHLVFSLIEISLKLAFLQGTLVPLNGEWSLETKIWVLHTFNAPGVSLFLGFFGDRTRIYTHMTER